MTDAVRLHVHQRIAFIGAGFHAFYRSQPKTQATNYPHLLQQLRACTHCVRMYRQ